MKQFEDKFEDEECDAVILYLHPSNEDEIKKVQKWLNSEMAKKITAPMAVFWLHVQDTTPSLTSISSDKIKGFYTIYGNYGNRSRIKEEINKFVNEHLKAKGENQTQKDALSHIKSLNNYIDTRNDNPQELYHGFLSLLFGGCTRDSKIKAASTLMAVLKGEVTSDFLQPHTKALSQGELGKLYTTIKESGLIESYKEPHNLGGISFAS